VDGKWGMGLGMEMGELCTFTIQEIRIYRYAKCHGKRCSEVKSCMFMVGE